MNMTQIMYDLAYWFDFGTAMLLNHPLTALTVVVGAFLFHQAIGGMKLIISAITFALAGITALFLDSLMF